MRESTGEKRGELTSIASIHQRSRLPFRTVPHSDDTLARMKRLTEYSCAICKFPTCYRIRSAFGRGTQPALCCDMPQEVPMCVSCILQNSWDCEAPGVILALTTGMSLLIHLALK